MPPRLLDARVRSTLKTGPAPIRDNGIQNLRHPFDRVRRARAEQRRHLKTGTPGKETLRQRAAQYTIAVAIKFGSKPNASVYCVFCSNTPCRIKVPDRERSTG